MYIFFDTETTGVLPGTTMTADTLTLFPRLIQLSCVVYDTNFNLIQEFDRIVYPDGYEITNFNIHGISQEVALDNGSPLRDVLEDFQKLVSAATLVVAHNYEFDSTVIEGELMRLGLDNFLSGVNSFCTMSESSPLSNRISLQRLHELLFGQTFEKQHDALIDAKATASCFFEMIRIRQLIQLGDSYVYHDPKSADFEIELDKGNSEFFNAYSIIRHTSKHIFLTGKAGTGKTTFLKYLRSNINKKIVTLSFTGVAAINAGGQTINSFFKLPFRPFVPDDSALSKENIYGFLKYTENKRELLRSVDILIFDEVSMVRVDLIDVIDRILRVFRKKENVPFGGVQVIFIGDLFQLPPIEGEEWRVVSEFYKSPYFFSSKVFNVLNQKGEIINIELQKIYRQNEIEFIDILNRVRVGKQSNNDLRVLNTPERIVGNVDSLLDDNYIVLANTNRKVNSINEERLGKNENDLFVFEGTVEGDFPESMKNAPQSLRLKVDAQVMLLANIGRLYNGKIGKVLALTKDKIEVLFDGEVDVTVLEKSRWDNIEYEYDRKANSIKQRTKGYFIQFPLKLSWSITVHKSQGLTFNKVVGDLSGSFAPGQVYVALSRCTSLIHLRLLAPLLADEIKIDRRVVDFSNVSTPQTTVVDYINEGRSIEYYREFRKLMLRGDVDAAFTSLENGVKYRNDIFSLSFRRMCGLYIQKYLNYQRLIPIWSRESKSNLERVLVQKFEYDGVQKRLEAIKLEMNVLAHSFDDREANRVIEVKGLESRLRDAAIRERDLSDKLVRYERENVEINRLLDLKNKQLDDFKVTNLKLRHDLDLLKSKWYTRLFK